MTNYKEEEKLPIIAILDAIKKHKKTAITVIVLVIIAVGGYYGYKNYKKQEIAASLIEQSIKHLADITGTYSNFSIRLELHADNTAILTTNVGGYYEAKHLGHWEEKAEGYPIDIDFSESFHASMCGKEDGYFSSLYFWNNSLWASLSAIQSRDYNSAEHLSKEN